MYMLPHWDRSCDQTFYLIKSILTPGQLVPVLTLWCQVPGMAATGVSILHHWFNSTWKNPFGENRNPKPLCQWGSPVRIKLYRSPAHSSICQGHQCCCLSERWRILNSCMVYYSSFVREHNLNVRVGCCYLFWPCFYWFLIVIFIWKLCLSQSTSVTSVILLSLHLFL